MADHRPLRYNASMINEAKVHIQPLHSYFSYCLGFCTLILCWTLAAPASATAQQLGDRLVVAINQVPYSQRQLELYFAVRAGIRNDADQTGLFVDRSNWSASLALFTEDMMILQEAQRLGSFGSVDAMLEKYSAQLRARRAAGGAFAATLKRLGADDQALAHVLENVLRVAAFRRSKNRQEAQALPNTTAAAQAQPGVLAKWLVDLSNRAATRTYTGANTFQMIAPALRSRGDGP